MRREPEIIVEDKISRIMILRVLSAEQLHGHLDRVVFCDGRRRETKCGDDVDDSARRRMCRYIEGGKTCQLDGCDECVK